MKTPLAFKNYLRTKKLSFVFCAIILAALGTLAYNFYFEFTRADFTVPVFIILLAFILFFLFLVFLPIFAYVITRIRYKKIKKYLSTSGEKKSVLVVGVERVYNLNNFPLGHSGEWIELFLAVPIFLLMYFLKINCEFWVETSDKAFKAHFIAPVNENKIPKIGDDLDILVDRNDATVVCLK